VVNVVPEVPRTEEALYAQVKRFERYVDQDGDEDERDAGQNHHVNDEADDQRVEAGHRVFGGRHAFGACPGSFAEHYVSAHDHRDGGCRAKHGPREQRLFDRAWHAFHCGRKTSSPLLIAQEKRDMSGASGENFGRVVDRFEAGCSAYNVLALRLVEKPYDSVWTPSGMVEDILKPASKSNVPGYANELEKYGKKVGDVVTYLKNVNGPLEKFKTYVTESAGIEKADKSITAIESAWKEFTEVDKIKQDVNSADSPEKHVNKFETVVKRGNKALSFIGTDDGVNLESLGSMYAQSRRDDVKDFVRALDALKNEVSKLKPSSGDPSTRGGSRHESDDYVGGRGDGRRRGSGRGRGDGRTTKTTPKWAPESFQGATEFIKQFVEEYDSRLVSDIFKQIKAGIEKKRPEKAMQGIIDKIRGNNDALLKGYVEFVLDVQESDSSYSASDGTIDDPYAEFRLSDGEMKSSIRMLSPRWLFDRSQQPFQTFQKLMTEVQSRLIRFSEEAAKQKEGKEVLPKTKISALTSLINDFAKKANKVGESGSGGSAMGNKTHVNEAKEVLVRLSRTAMEAWMAHNESMLRVTGKAAKKVPDVAMRGDTMTPSYLSSSSSSSSSGPLSSMMERDRLRYDDNDGRSGMVDGRTRHTGDIRAPEFLYRKPNLKAMRSYEGQIKGFLGKLNDDMDPEKTLREMVFQRANDALEKADAQMADLEGELDPSKLNYDRKRLGEYKGEEMLKMVDGIRVRFKQYADVHTNFATKKHREGLRYMLYWRKVNYPDERVREAVRDYFEVYKQVLAMADAHLSNMKEAYGKALRGNDAESGQALAQWHTGVGDDQRKLVRDGILEVDQYVKDMEMRIRKAYEGKLLRLLDVFMDSQFLIMYGIKAARIGSVWVALLFAERYFQLSYAKLVYGENKDPPHPARMVGVFVMLDVLINLCILAVLFMVRALYKSQPRFPIDMVFIGGYLLDYVCTMVVILLLGVVIGDVIHKKKYFRYRYEGDRGVRALKTMLFYISIIVIVVPFFRLF